MEKISRLLNGYVVLRVHKSTSDDFETVQCFAVIDLMHQYKLKRRAQ